MGEFSNFVWYESWWNTILSFDRRLGEEFGNKLIRNIIYYGMTGDFLITEDDIDYDMITGYITGSIARNIDNAKNRYEKACAGGEKGGRQKLIGEKENIQIALLKLQGKSQKETAAILGVSDSTIKRSEGWKNPEEFRLKAELGQNLGQNLGQSSVQDLGQIKN